MNKSVHENTRYALLLIISILNPAKNIINVAMNQPEVMPTNTLTSMIYLSSEWCICIGLSRSKATNSHEC